MRSILRVVLTSVVLSAGFLTAACDTFDFEIFDTKKKLPGERKPVFPEGVPGVSQGVPAEYLPGYQEPTPEKAAEAPKPEEEAAKTAAKPVKPKPKPKPRQAAAKPVAEPAAPLQQVQPQQEAAPRPAPAQPWPAPQPQAAWPSAPPPGQFSR
jgi:hypothetical protein